MDESFHISTGSAANGYDFLDQNSKSFPLEIYDECFETTSKTYFLIFFCKICIKSFAPYAIIRLFKHNIQIHSETSVYIPENFQKTSNTTSILGHIFVS